MSGLSHSKQIDKFLYECSFLEAHPEYVFGYRPKIQEMDFPLFPDVEALRAQTHIRDLLALGGIQDYIFTHFGILISEWRIAHWIDRGELLTLKNSRLKYWVTREKFVNDVVQKYSQEGDQTC